MFTKTASRLKRRKIITGKPICPGKRLNVFKMDNFLFSIYPDLVLLLIEKYGKDFSQSKEFIALRKKVFSHKNEDIIFDDFKDLAAFFDNSQIKSMAFKSLENGKFATTNPRGES